MLPSSNEMYVYMVVHKKLSACSFLAEPIQFLPLVGTEPFHTLSSLYHSPAISGKCASPMVYCGLLVFIFFYKSPCMKL
jgi:hypothetical protein